MTINKKDWSIKFDDALLAYRMAFKMPIGMNFYHFLFSKDCHLPIELEDRAYWEIKKLNFDLQALHDRRTLEFNKLEELENKTYKSAWTFKDRTKK